MDEGTPFYKSVPANKTTARLVYQHLIEIQKILQNQCFQTEEVVNASMMLESVSYHIVKTVIDNYATKAPPPDSETANNLEI